jgi:hypothetical protein
MAAVPSTNQCSAHLPTPENQAASKPCNESTKERKNRIRFFYGFSILCTNTDDKIPTLARFLESQELERQAVLNSSEFKMLRQYLKTSDPGNDECDVCINWDRECDDCADISYDRLGYRWAEYKAMFFSLEYLSNKGLIAETDFGQLLEEAQKRRR